MSAVEITKTKRDLISWINELDDREIIEFLDALKQSVSNKDELSWNSLSDTQKKLIMKGVDDVEKGNVFTSDQFWNLLKNG